MLRANKDFDGSTVTTGEIVPALAGHTILVLEATLMADSEGTLTFKSGSTAISPDFPVAALGFPVVLPESPNGWCETTAGAALNAGVDIPLGFGYVHVGYEYRKE